MPSLTHRRLSVLEERRDRRDVPPIVIMVEPLSPEQEAEATAHRKRGSVVLVLDPVSAAL